jgi:cellulose synthase operon protein C
MKRGSPIRLWAAGLLLCSALCGPAMLRASAQTSQSQTVKLLEQAHSLEESGRMDLAKQKWQQVLLVEPGNSEGLAGLARAAKLEGKNDDAKAYLDRLRALNPNDPNIPRIENTTSQRSTSAELQEAGKLAQAGQYARAMTILRQVYGDRPPSGNVAISYYQTEAATENGRAHAIAGLRALMEQNPRDARYQIALGTILTYNPRTRAEGRRLLERHPDSPEATEALRQSLVWDSQNPATAADIRSYLATHKDQQLSTALAQIAARKRAKPPTADEIASQEAVRARTPEDQAAYNSLNLHHVNQAEAGFKAAIAKNPADAQALAGMGYVRMEQANFGGAISFLEQAEQEGAHDPGVTKALLDSRFYFTMQEATAALNANDLATAQYEFHSALQMRPGSPEATLGLGGTLLKGQHTGAAIAVFEPYTKARPGDVAGWRGLLTADHDAERYAEALALDKRVPPAVHEELMRDPDYLRTLASVYSAGGREAEAQQVLQIALDLPFPASARGVKADAQLQYAGLLLAAKRYEQASGLYRQVLAADTTNTEAWQGLIQTEHAVGQDANALQALGAMPPQNYQAAMQEPGFETLVASIYESQGQMDKAQRVLETFLTAQRAQNKQPFVPAQLQLASIYMLRGNSQQAYPLYREVLSANPDRLDAWKGMFAAMHGTGHDQEALAQVAQIPPEARQTLESDTAYLQTVGAIYAGLGHPQEATSFLYRVQQIYAARGMGAPPDVDIQSAWLLYSSGDDAALYRALMGLGARLDLSDDQRRTVQTIWAAWAVKRSNQSTAVGNTKRALAILNAAAQAFPDNVDVIKALASGYANAGLPKHAVALFKAQDLSSGSAADYKAAVGAALASDDLKDAETWLRFGLEQYPRDSQLLSLAAKFETARGDPNRATEYYRASLRAMPPPRPGEDLEREMAQPVPVRPGAAGVPDLATLLRTPGRGEGYGEVPQVVDPRPYLPGSAMPLSGIPAYDVAPVPAAPPSGKLKDYVPQSKLDDGDGVIHLHPASAVWGPHRTYGPVGSRPVARLHLAAFQQSTTAPQTAPDGTPIVPYAATAKPAQKTVPKPTQSEAAKTRAAAIRANQDSAPQDRTGVSHPPDENYDAAQSGAQLEGAQFNPAQTQGTQVPRPQPQQPTDAQNGSGAQQYPQPTRKQPTATKPRPRQQTTTQQPATQQPAQQPVPQAPVPASAPPITYPVYPQPLGNPGVPVTGGTYPLPNPPTDQDLMQQNVPPLRGYYDPRPDQPVPLSERQQTQLDLANLEGAYSGWAGGSALARYRSGTPGIDWLAVLQASGEMSVIANRKVRFTIVTTGVFLNSGVLDTSSGTLGTQPVLGTLPGNAINPPQQQFATGVGGEIQMVTNTFSAAAGYTPYGFLVSNVIGRASWKPGDGHFTMYGGRDSVKETQLSWAGLRDPGSSFTNGNIWGGVVETGGGVRLDFGSEKTAFYVQAEGADLTGFHVLENRRFDGTAAATFQVRSWKDVGSLNIGGTMFGEHFNHNERGETYGLGGYFSPNAYFLAAVPLTFIGHQGTYFHYTVSGGAGIQTFQEARQVYFPLDLPIQTQLASGCTTAVAGACAVFPVNSQTELNYSVDAKVAYQMTDHWFVGAFLSGNNTNHYNTVSGGFFVRVTFRKEFPTADYPTGLFPVEGFRPVKVP